ncbi:MAG: hypothetical protein WC548_03895 [Candidatus Pacearchaeota archaeon]
MKKRGLLGPKEILEILLAGAVVILLVMLLYSIIDSRFNKNEKTAESYFNSFGKAVEFANSGGRGNFSMWQKESETKFYLIYFEKKTSFDLDNIKFSSVGANENHICICYYNDGKSSCDFCENLDYPVKIENRDFEQFAIEGGREIEIIKVSNENFYHFLIQ